MRRLMILIGLIIGLLVAAVGAPIVCLADDQVVEIRDDAEEIKAAGQHAQEDDGHWEQLGTYKLTAYCPCRKCCGKWSGGPTASGVMPAAGRTIAVSGIPFGTHVWIDGLGEFVVEDRGVHGKHIDVYMANHSTARAFGVQYAAVSRWVPDGGTK